MTRFDTHLQWIDQQQDQMIALLTQWASINTGSHHVAGLAAFSEELRPVLERLTPHIEEIPLPPHITIADSGEPESQPLGNALSFRSRARGGAIPRVFLAIHMDTVFGADHSFQSVAPIEGHALRGPGVCDAKGGLIVLLFALLALEHSPFASSLVWEVLLNPDEELGSPGSAPLFTLSAARNDVGLVFEPALPDGALVSHRKGSGNFTIIVHGRAAHAGRDSHLGRNAIQALAQLVTKLASLQREIPGIVVNTGFIQGGGPVNIVPNLALCRINIRIENVQQQQAIEHALQDIITKANEADGITAEVHGGFHCPPKPITPPVERLLENLHDCAGQLGIPLTWRGTGGVCDGNRLAAAGLPTIDSLGVRGGNIHTDQEFIWLDSLVERTRLTALFLMRLASIEFTIERRTSIQSADYNAEVCNP